MEAVAKIPLVPVAVIVKVNSIIVIVTAATIYIQPGTFPSTLIY